MMLLGFEKEGWIEVEQKHVRIVDIAALQGMLNGARN
jgi:hypothetical protein